MGIFYEDTINDVKFNDNISVMEMMELVKERDELLSELIDITLMNLNETLMFTESAWDDLKVKKEDLMNPVKVKALANKIERERIGMDSKATALNVLYVFLLSIVGMVPGAIVIAAGVAMDSAMFAVLGELILYVGGIITPIIGADRYSTLKRKIEKAVKKVDKAISKESDPKYKKVLQDQKRALEKSYDYLDREQLKLAKEIDRKTTYGYNVNYNIN